MSIQESLQTVLTTPTPGSLWQFRGDLLQVGMSETLSLWPIVDRFYEYLNELSAGMSAHEYSKLATLLDIGAIGGVAVESLLESDLSTTDFWRRLMVGSASEALMVLASRQYVKAFQEETTAVCRSAAWYLYQELWQVSAQAQPQLDPEARRLMIERLLAPVHDENINCAMKAVLIGRLFQILMLIHFSEALANSES